MPSGGRPEVNGIATSMRKYQIYSCFFIKSNLAIRPYRVTRSLIRSPIKRLNLKTFQF